MKRIAKWAGVVAVLLVLAGFAFLKSMGMFASAEVYANADGAIGGYDPVAYFDEQRPVKGSEQFSTEWNGATWYFSSEERMRRFVADPERYAPQFGGYCAMAVSGGYTARTSPDAFALVNGKLYLNFDQDVLAQWNADRDNLIPAAEKNWPGVLLGL